MIDQELAAFMTRGVSILAASRGPENAPALARATGCRLSADRSRVTLLLARSQAGALLAAAEATGAIAVVFSQPSTHRTIQLKGADARVSEAAAGDEALAARYADAFAAEVCPLGYTE